MAPQSMVICVDNGDFTRDGDFEPTRLVAQHDVASKILRAQLQASVLNDVALLSTAGKNAQLLSPLIRDQVALQKKLYAMEIGGVAQPVTALRIAQLVLKHRPERNNIQRVVLFVASPIELDTMKDGKKLRALGQNLRKANISLDLILLGTKQEIDHNSMLFSPLATVLGTNCNIRNITAEQNLTEAVFPYATGSSEQLGASDEPEDAELAMAIKMSLRDLQVNKEQDRAKSITRLPLESQIKSISSTKVSKSNVAVAQSKSRGFKSQQPKANQASRRVLKIARKVQSTGPSKVNRSGSMSSSLSSINGAKLPKSKYSKSTVMVPTSQVGYLRANQSASSLGKSSSKVNRSTSLSSSVSSINGAKLPKSKYSKSTVMVPKSQVDAPRANQSASSLGKSNSKVKQAKQSKKAKQAKSFSGKRKQ